LIEASAGYFLGELTPMPTSQVTTKSSKQIATDFAAVFERLCAELVSAKPAMADQMKPYRKHILKLRRLGLSWNQIATGMGQAPINEKVSGKTLRRLFGDANPTALQSQSPPSVPDPQAAPSPTPPVPPATK
jgi:hypothetical protein